MITACAFVPHPVPLLRHIQLCNQMVNWKTHASSGSCWRCSPFSIPWQQPTFLSHNVSQMSSSPVNPLAHKLHSWPLYETLSPSWSLIYKSLCCAALRRSLVIVGAPKNLFFVSCLHVKLNPILMHDHRNHTLKPSPNHTVSATLRLQTLSARHNVVHTILIIIIQRHLCSRVCKAIYSTSLFFAPFELICVPTMENKSFIHRLIYAHTCGDMVTWQLTYSPESVLK